MKGEEVVVEVSWARNVVFFTHPKHFPLPSEATHTRPPPLSLLPPPRAATQPARKSRAGVVVEPGRRGASKARAPRNTHTSSNGPHRGCRRCLRSWHAPDHHLALLHTHRSGQVHRRPLHPPLQQRGSRRRGLPARLPARPPPLPAVRLGAVGGGQWVVAEAGVAPAPRPRARGGGGRRVCPGRRARRARFARRARLPPCGVWGRPVEPRAMRGRAAGAGELEGERAAGAPIRSGQNKKRRSNQRAPLPSLPPSQTADSHVDADALLADLQVSVGEAERERGCAQRPSRPKYTHMPAHARTTLTRSGRTLVLPPTHASTPSRPPRTAR